MKRDVVVVVVAALVVVQVKSGSFSSVQIEPLLGHHPALDVHDKEKEEEEKKKVETTRKT